MRVEVPFKAELNKAKKDTLILLNNDIFEELRDLQAMEEACIPQDEGENDNQSLSSGQC